MTERVAVLGLGEAGTRYAADLIEAGVDVVGYDPVAAPDVAGLRRAGSPAEAVADATVVLSLNSASVAVDVAGDAVAGLGAGTVYADLNTAAPSVKAKIAEVVAGGGARFVDAAVLAPVPRAGLRSPLMVSGDGRDAFTAFLAPFGAPVADGGATPGAAAGAKLLRSVFMKGLAAVIGEALDAAEVAGQQDWMREQIVAELTSADAALVERLVVGTRTHAGRRVKEMEAVTAYLDELGASSLLTRATTARLGRLAAGDG